MVVKAKDGRAVEISTYGKHSDDIQIDSAVYVDSGEDVPDEVVEEIYDRYSSDIYEDWYMNKVSEAEYAADAMEDR